MLYCIYCQLLPLVLEILLADTFLLTTIEAAHECRGRQGQSVRSHRFLEGRAPQQEHRAGGAGASIQRAPGSNVRGRAEAHQRPGERRCASSST